MFNYVDSSVLGGLCIASQNIADNDDGKTTISSADIVSLYPYIMLTTIFTEILKASHNNQTSIFAFTFKFKPISCLKNCRLVIINSFLNLTKTDTVKTKTIHVC